MIGFISKNYISNIPFKASITDKDIDSFRDAKQHFSDCYLMCTLETLSQSKNGRKILKENIHRDDLNKDNINCFLYAPTGERIKYTVPTENIVKGYEKVYKYQSNEIIRSMDISVNEYEKKYKNKFFISDIRDNFKDYKFEYNLPSNFMKTFTGIEPRVIGEKGLNVDLTKYREEVFELFKKIEEEDDYSFVLSTGIKPLNGHRWHVYILEDVNLENNTISVREKRENESQTISIDEALKTFKCIVGYLNSDLEKSS